MTPRKVRSTEERLNEHQMQERTLRRKVALEKNPPMKLVRAALAMLERARGQSTQHSRTQYPAFWVRVDSAASSLNRGMDTLCDPIQPAPPHPDSRTEPVREDPPFAGNVREDPPFAGNVQAAIGGDA